MPDLLVKLYDLPAGRPPLPEGVTIRPVNAAEITMAAEWVAKTFSQGWADEFKRGAMAAPATSLIAVEERKIIGFVCHDVSALGLFGPTGVGAKARGRGIGKALLFAALDAMKANGHAYAVIGWAGPVEFYAETVGATIIEGSERRYRGVLIEED